MTGRSLNKNCGTTLKIAEQIHFKNEFQKPLKALLLVPETGIEPVRPFYRSDGF